MRGGFRLESKVEEEEMGALVLDWKSVYVWLWGFGAEWMGGWFLVGFEVGRWDCLLARLVLRLICPSSSLALEVGVVALIHWIQLLLPGCFSPFVAREIQ